MLNTNLITKQVLEYICYKRGMGYQLKVEAEELQRFATYTRNLDYEGSLCGELAYQWATMKPEYTTWYMSRRLETVRTFAKYICVFDKQAQMPPKGLFGKCHGRTIPYVYSEIEICKIITETSKLFSPDGLRALTMPTAIGLMWSTGMRPSEVCNLKNLDIDLLNEFITVKETKFSKSRVLPLHRTTVEKLQKYLCNRNHLLQCNISDYFFLSTGGKELKLINLENALKLTRISLLSNEESCWNRRPPRLYDIRHSFACNTILRWYKEGVDVNSKIAYLSTYMGHVKIQDTYWYLTGTTELLEYTSTTFEDYFKEGGRV